MAPLLGASSARMVPIAAHRVTLANTRRRAARIPAPRAALGCGVPLDAARHIARDHVRRRVAEPIAVAGLAAPQQPAQAALQAQTGGGGCNAISGYVYVYLDDNGLRSTEPPIPGSVIGLYRQPTNTLVISATTDASGYYSFSLYS